MQAANIGLQSGHYTADVCRYADSKFLQIVEFLPAWRQCEARTTYISDVMSSDECAGEALQCRGGRSGTNQLQKAQHYNVCFEQQRLCTSRQR